MAEAPNADEILNRIYSPANRKGSYSEGFISAGINELTNLQNQVKSGDLSQSDYVNLTNQIIPRIDKTINQIAGSGSGGASAARAAGMDDFYNKIMPDYNIYKGAQEVLGRDITEQDLYAIRPYFQGPNGLINGQAYLSNLAKEEAKSPERLGQKAPEYSGQVGDVFQELLNRGATQAEIDHFGKLMATGDITEYQLRNFIQQLPEYREAEAGQLQQKQAEEDLAARQQLGSELGQYDQEFFNKAREGLISRYAQAGRTGSSSLDFALTNLMGDIQKERSAYLADIARRDYESQRGAKREDYLSNKGLLREDYLTNLNRMFGNQDYGTQRRDSLSDLLLNRGFEGADYVTQRRDLENLLSQYNPNRGNGGVGSLVGGVIGGGIGAFGGPGGASAGYQIGSGIGGIYDWQKNR